jgi:hypothetical protein
LDCGDRHGDPKEVSLPGVRATFQKSVDAEDEHLTKLDKIDSRCYQEEQQRGDDVGANQLRIPMLHLASRRLVRHRRERLDPLWCSCVAAGDTRRAETLGVLQEIIKQALVFAFVTADVKTAEDVQLPTPQLGESGDGQRAPDPILVRGECRDARVRREVSRRAEQVRSRA